MPGASCSGLRRSIRVCRRRISHFEIRYGGSVPYHPDALKYFADNNIEMKKNP
jgi:hypothetical protein